MHRLKFETNDGAKVRFGRDVFDNCVAACSFPEPATELRFQLELDLALEKKNPFDFLLRNEVASMPFSYPADLRRVLAPFRQKEAGPTPGNSALGVPAARRAPTDRRRCWWN